MKKIFLLLFFPIFVFSQCENPQACNYGANEECLFEYSNDISIINNICLQEVDWLCNGTVDLVFYTEYNTNGSYT
jgi:hypothetical protein